MHDDAYEKNQQLAEEDFTVPHLRMDNLCMESWASLWMILRGGRVGCVACRGGTVRRRGLAAVFP